MAYERLTWLDDDGSLTVGTLYSAAIMNRIETGINELHVGHDAISNSAEFSKAEAFTWTHTPVATNPRGILVFVVQDSESGVASDQVTTVTYGGVAMAEVTSSPYLKTLGANDASLHAFFLGTGIPTGAQTVSVTSTGTQKKRAVAISLQGNKDLRVEAVKTLEEEVTTLAPAALTGTGQESVVYGFAQAGATAVGEIAPTAGSTELFESAIATTRAMSVLRKTANGSGGSQGVSWTLSAKKAIGAFVVAVGPVRDFGVVTALPSIAGIGDHCHYVADSANGVIWDCVNDGQTTRPWKAQGPPIFEAVETSEQTTSKTYVALTTAGPSVTAPLLGDYDIEIGATVGNTAIALSYMSYKVGASAAVDEDAAILEGPASLTISLGRKKRRASVAAATAFVAQYKVSAGTGFFSRRWMALHPVRLG